jgi:hypothetical protein
MIGVKMGEKQATDVVRSEIVRPNVLQNVISPRSYAGVDQSQLSSPVDQVNMAITVESQTETS